VQRPKPISQASTVQVTPSLQAALLGELEQSVEPDATHVSVVQATKSSHDPSFLVIVHVVPVHDSVVQMKLSEQFEQKHELTSSAQASVSEHQMPWGLESPRRQHSSCDWK
jgi:hypothetical protein